MNCLYVRFSAALFTGYDSDLGEHDRLFLHDGLCLPSAE